MERYPNKRARPRGPGGRFRSATLGDVGLAGWCPTCGHLMIREYTGDDPRCPDPRAWRERCLGCEPWPRDRRPQAGHVAEFFDAAGG